MNCIVSNNRIAILWPYRPRWTWISSRRRTKGYWIRNS